MAEKKKAFIDIIPVARYEAALPERITRDQVEEHQHYSLFVRENEKSHDAYCLAVNIADIQHMSSLGVSALKTILLTPDLEPVKPSLNASLDEDNMWSGKIYVTANNRRFVVPRGFIAPYDDLADRTALEAFESMSMSR